MLGPYFAEYDPTVNPGIVQEFQSAAMRFGHTLVPPGVYRRYDGILIFVFNNVSIDYLGFQ